MTNEQIHECMQILSFAEKKLIKQGNGTRCAIGWFIPDSIYKKYIDDLENNEDPIDELISINEYEQCFGTRFPEKTEVLRRLQDIHDYIEPEKWQESFDDHRALLIENLIR